MRRVECIHSIDTEGFFRQFLNGADVGLAIFDEQLRYRALNARLAAINCSPAVSHIGKTPFEMFGDLGRRVEPAMQKAFNSGVPTLNLEIMGALPGQSREGHWINNIFAVRDATGRVKQVAAVVIELAKDIRLQPAEWVGISVATPVLRSWKEIAQYVGTCVKTVQRWEQIYDFPIRRLQATKGAPVFALRTEVEEWIESRTSLRKRV